MRPHKCHKPIPGPGAVLDVHAVELDIVVLGGPMPRVGTEEDPYPITLEVWPLSPCPPTKVLGKFTGIAKGATRGDLGVNPVGQVVNINFFTQYRLSTHLVPGRPPESVHVKIGPVGIRYELGGVNVIVKLNMLGVESHIVTVVNEAAFQWIADRCSRRSHGYTTMGGATDVACPPTTGRRAILFRCFAECADTLG